ncbi:MAG: transposase [Gammaproteobacteria bacterium]
MLTEASVDWEGLGDALAKETDDLLGGESSVLILDESAIANKGESSAGVARQ